MVAFDASGAIYGDAIQLAAATATVSGNGGTVVAGQYTTVRLTLNVTVASGTTPSLTVNIQTSGDGTTWVAVASFAAKTTTGTERKTFSGLDRYVRATWTISGTTPSFTFSVAGEAL